MSTSVPSASERTGSTEDVVVRLAHFMGWSVSADALTIGRAHLSGATPVLFPFTDNSGYGVSSPDCAGKRWSPFADANADLQVLERAREVWLAPARAWMETLPKYGPIPSYMRQWSEFQRTLPASWEYTAGAFSRCVLAVLRSTEGEKP